MAHSMSALKRVRQNEKRRLHNRMVMSQTRNAIKKASQSIESGDKAVAEVAVREAVSSLDRAAKKGVLHRNSAARKKSTLMRSYNAM